MKRLLFCLLTSICMVATACSGSGTESTATTEAPAVTEAPSVTETTAEESIEAEELGSLEEELAKSMPVGDEEFFNGAVDSEETALCIATEVVSSVGENKLAELGITPASLNDGTVTTEDSFTDETLLNGIIGGVEKCADVEGINESLIFGISMFLPQVIDSAECMEALLDDGLRTEVLIGQIAGITETQEWLDEFFTELFAGCPTILTSILAEIFGEPGAACMAENMAVEDMVTLLNSDSDGSGITAEEEEYLASLIPWDACPDILLSMLAPFFGDDYALTSCIIEEIGSETIYQLMLRDDDADDLYTEAYMNCMFGQGDDAGSEWEPIETEWAWSSDGQQSFVDGCVFVVDLIPELSLYNSTDLCGCILGDMMKDVDEMEYYINMDQDGRDAAAEPYFTACMV
mgnify:FL=1